MQRIPVKLADCSRRLNVIDALRQAKRIARLRIIMRRGALKLRKEIGSVAKHGNAERFQGFKGRGKIKNGLRAR